ncbi:MAG TPA: cation transporter [Cycloclasticus sp.]|jgi:cation diffusion facilitator family transporter|nr:cation transporter [Cycloclasticus sp.]
MAGCNSCSSDKIATATKQQKRVLIIVLLINATMFVVEFSAGLVSHSTALMADSLDMLADALVYALGLFALERAEHWKNRAALTSGIFQMTLGLGILVQPIYLLTTNNMPDAFSMGLFGLLALLANSITFFLLMAYRDGDINMRATWVCTRNDMINNIGVMLAAGLVYWLSSPLPDIVIGLVIAAIVMHSAWGVIREAHSTTSSSP